MSGPAVRPLAAAERERFVLARVVAADLAPYMAPAVFAMQPVAAEGLGTVAVDRRWRLYLDPEAVQQWSVQQYGGALLHEAGHLLREHADRADDLGGVEHQVWNLATDAAINDGLLASGVQLPDGVVTPAALGLDPDGVEEAYYADLVREQQQSSGAPWWAGDDEAGCGSGAGDPRAAWELDDTGRSGVPAGDGTWEVIAPGVNDADAEVARRQVAVKVREHADSPGSGQGSVPAGLRRWAEAVLTPAAVPWQRVLRSALRRAVAWRRGAVDYTYSRPGRRHVPGIVTPATRRPLVNVAVVVDTSASVSAAQLAVALREIKGLLRSGVTGSGHGITLLSCDAEAGSATRVRQVRDVNLTGGGGTDMRVGIDAALALRPRPDAVVVLTDGYTSWPEQPLRARLVVGLLGSPGEALDRAVRAVPSWAQTIAISADE